MAQVENKKENDFKYQNLSEGDIVEFSENTSEGRFGIVTGGFGLLTCCSGSTIYGIFGSTIEEAKSNFIASLNRKKIVEKLPIEQQLNAYTPMYEGNTRRQPCRIVGKVNLKTGEDA